MVLAASCEYGTQKEMGNRFPISGKSGYLLILEITRAKGDKTPAKGSMMLHLTTMTVMVITMIVDFVMLRIVAMLIPVHVVIVVTISHLHFAG